MFFSPTYLIYMLPAFILMGLTSWYVKSSYNKWSRVQASSRLTGAQAAQRLLSTGSMYGVKIQTVAGDLTDHYDPRDKTLSLSPPCPDTGSRVRDDDALPDEPIRITERWPMFL